ncbi:hypothetical protein ACQR2B_06620 [Bradyrhizobium oligotrophicum]|uniref:hypothetical protein n=1 Tax=Bradyrhizobium TaxID=374 RepID=UPI003EB7E70A
MSDLIAALDRALADRGEDFVLRRVTGSGASVTNTDVTCRGRIDAVTVEQVAAGIKASDLNVILSPTQINAAGWPGTTDPTPAPFNVDPRIPRENGADKVIIRGVLRQILFCKPFFVGGELVRIELRVSG